VADAYGDTPSRPAGIGHFRALPQPSATSGREAATVHGRRSGRIPVMVVALGLLAVAIAVEVASTAALPRADGFRDPVWAVIVLTGYAVAVWLLALVVQRLPVSVTYAIWSGLGTASIAVIGVLFLGESWNVVKVVSIGLIILGVVALNLQWAH